MSVQQTAVAPPPPRHALGLPAGSIRALLTLIIVGIVCALLLMPGREGQPIPIQPYLIYLLFLSLGHFFAAHGSTIAPAGAGQPSPLHLPAGFIRLLIVVVLVATVGWKLATARDALLAQIAASVALLPEEPYMPIVILAGFFVGVVFRWITGGDRSYWAQDVQAWFALIAILVLAVAALIHLVINPSLEADLHLPDWDGFVAAVVAFYFGERS
jgi:hypothetical protein